MLSVLEYLDRAGSSPFAAWSLPLGWVKPHAVRRRLQEARAQREAGGLRGVSEYERAWRVVRIGSEHLASVDFSRPISRRLQATVSDFFSIRALTSASYCAARELAGAVGSIARRISFTVTIFVPVWIHSDSSMASANTLSEEFAMLLTCGSSSRSASKRTAAEPGTTFV